jgi:hypothetical protein
MTGRNAPMTPNANITQPNANHRAFIMMVSRISQMPGLDRGD